MPANRGYIYIFQHGVRRKEMWNFSREAFPYTIRIQRAGPQIWVWIRSRQKWREARKPISRLTRSPRLKHTQTKLPLFHLLAIIIISVLLLLNIFNLGKCNQTSLAPHEDSHNSNLHKVLASLPASVRHALVFLLLVHISWCETILSARGLVYMICNDVCPGYNW